MDSNLGNAIEAQHIGDFWLSQLIFDVAQKANVENRAADALSSLEACGRDAFETVPCS